MSRARSIWTLRVRAQCARARCARTPKSVPRRRTCTFTPISNIGSVPLIGGLATALLLSMPRQGLGNSAIASVANEEQLERFKGTLVFVSHDREFVSSLATRVIDMQPAGEGKPAKIIDFRGTYEEYLREQGVPD